MFVTCKSVVVKLVENPATVDERVFIALLTDDDRFVMRDDSVKIDSAVDADNVVTAPLRVATVDDSVATLPDTVFMRPEMSVVV